MLTANMLRMMGACSDQVAVFEVEWPAGIAAPTVKIVQRAMVLGLDMGWLCKKVALTPLWAEYETKRALLLAECDAKLAPMMAAEHKTKRASVLAEYDAKRSLLWAEYKAKRVSLLAKYDEKIAQLKAHATKRTSLWVELLTTCWLYLPSRPTLN